MDHGLSNSVVYFPLWITGANGDLVVCLRSNGVPEFGPGVDTGNVWQKIAEALPRPEKLGSPHEI